MKNLYVGNLAFTTTEHELRALFETHGVVERVTIAIDTQTGRPRGFAFVEMTNPLEADKACAALTGASVGGRTLRVNVAKQKLSRGLTHRTLSRSRCEADYWTPQKNISLSS